MTETTTVPEVNGELSKSALKKLQKEQEKQARKEAVAARLVISTISFCKSLMHI